MIGRFIYMYVCVCMCLPSISSVYCVCSVTKSWPALLWPPWIVAHQAPLFMGFFRQECWGGLPFPPSLSFHYVLHHRWISLPTESLEKPKEQFRHYEMCRSGVYSSMRFDKCTHSCTLAHQDTEYFHPQESSLCPFPVNYLTSRQLLLWFLSA